MSTVAIDTSSARNTERLSMFLTEIGNEDPIDQYFQIHPTWDVLWKNKKSKEGGRQVGYTIETGENPTVADTSDDDIIDTTIPDVVRWVVYPYVNKTGSVSVLGEEVRETAGSAHKTYDIIKQRRSSLLNTVMDKYSKDLFATSQVAGKITPLPVLIASSGSVGDLSTTTEATWASTQTGSGVFSAQGLDDMRTLYRTLRINKSNPDTIVTTSDVYGFYEAEVDADVRYASAQGSVNRGFESLTFNMKPIIYDPDCNSGVLYMWDSRYLFLSCDTGWNFDFEPFMKSFNQKTMASQFANRCNLITNARRTAGKLTGITGS